MKDFNQIIRKIDGYYIELIDKLQEEFQIGQFQCVYDGNTTALEKWYTDRVSYIERGKVLNSLTRLPEKLDAIKDYISMPGLPYHLFGSELILMVNSMYETDSYRKCKKAYRRAFQMGSILYPELLSEDGVNIIYDAPTKYKKYGNYEKLTSEYHGDR